jgi:hypothetical protein
VGLAHGAVIHAGKCGESGARGLGHWAATVCGGGQVRGGYAYTSGKVGDAAGAARCLDDVFEVHDESLKKDIDKSDMTKITFVASQI